MHVPCQLPFLPSSSYAPKIPHISLTKILCLVLHPTKVPFSLIPRAAEATEEDTHFLHSDEQGAVTFYLPLTACLYISQLFYLLLSSSCKSLQINTLFCNFQPCPSNFSYPPSFSSFYILYSISIHLFNMSTHDLI